ncbi:hypothetical protein M378DRAFT_170835 [Amanita muscaria Koide BX008]|uniref:Uncharacterized protein n=1 Tax=Amanita muscaria (strain Koide BX008) TaxID=946122 RepID=A0A0C2S676_AMAMK|nr:hypothetical protein M378DRAFT_170835 [Amanita muscaria Koide BX008]
MADGTLDALPLPTPTVSPTSPTSLASRSSRPMIRIITPASGTPNASPLTPNQRVDPADPQNLQYNIYLELVKLNANAKTRNHAPLTPAHYYPYISRRNAFWTSAQLTPTPASAHGRNDPIAMREGAEFDALGQQFTTLVIISTFTANLIIAFLTLAHNLISGRQDIYAYSMIIEVGQFLALIGMATHAGVIIISGRCAALASKHAKKQAKLVDEQREEEKEVKCEMPDEGDSERKMDHLAPSMATEERLPVTTPTTTQTGSSPYDIKNPSFPSLRSFRRFLTVCETLQLFGTAIFFLGVTVLIFLIFLHSMFPIVLTVGCVIGTCALSWLIGFWEISASKQLIRVVRSVWTRWMFGVGMWVGAACCVSSGGRRGGKSQRKRSDAHESDLEKGEATRSV